ncbi:HAD family hydrolase [Tropicimonas sp. S265A]|uniref:HAD family hydrolase n=1 Tax=Tropicimonas sp. S265A TaxID=3415134 RepID=UPI003C7CC9B6
MRPILFAAAIAVCAAPSFADPLPSWAETDTKAAIIEFVERVTDPASPDYVTPADRIATFDNDGNLWAEKPVYFQLIYALERVKERAAEDPSILESDMLRAAAEGDVEAIAEGGLEGLLEILAISHAGMSVEEFQDDVRAWLDTARHPTTGMRYDAMIYQPMLELLRYLRDEEFQTWIVSGGGVHFVRAFAQEAYNIPTEQVVGTAGPTEYVDGKVMKLPGIDFVDDKEGKPVGIDNSIGKRPIFASGNSDGDFAMLEYTTAGDGPRFGMLLHHTDAEREFAYDREGHIGVLNRGLDEGPDRGWVIIDMAEDWLRVFPE